MATVRFNNIGKIFPGGVVAVEDFTLEIESGEFVVLVGPSGCGKTTSLRMLAGLETPTSGEIYIDDKRVDIVAPKHRDIAMVFQNYALYPHMSVYDNLAFALRNRRMPRDEMDARIREAARSLEIETLLKRKPSALSGGQRQRVALGRAIVRQPSVFLMDEPLSNLDAQLRAQTRMEIIRLYRRLGSTFLYVTHDQTEAMTMGTRIVVMKEARIQQAGSPQEIYRNPANTFVAQFIGSPAMNLIPAVQEDGQLGFGAFRFSVSAPEGEWILGLRPEHLHVDEAFVAAHPGACFEAVVEVAENLGAQVYLHLRAEGVQKPIIASAHADCPLGAGDAVRCACDLANMRMFDAVTGEKSSEFEIIQ